MVSTIHAADVMQEEPITVSPNLSLAALEDLLLSHRIGGVPVVEEGALVGVVSRSDIVRVLSLERSLAGIVGESLREAEFAPGEEGVARPLPEALRKQLQAHTVRDAMVPDPITVSPTAPIDEVARQLVDRHVHRVLVTEGRKLVGLVTSLDVVGLVAERRLS